RSLPSEPLLALPVAAASGAAPTTNASLLNPRPCLSICASGRSRTFPADQRIPGATVDLPQHARWPLVLASRRSPRLLGSTDLLPPLAKLVSLNGTLRQSCRKRP